MQRIMTFLIVGALCYSAGVITGRSFDPPWAWPPRAAPRRAAPSAPSAGPESDQATYVVALQLCTDDLAALAAELREAEAQSEAFYDMSKVTETRLKACERGLELCDKNLTTCVEQLGDDR